MNLFLQKRNSTINHLKQLDEKSKLKLIRDKKDLAIAETKKKKTPKGYKILDQRIRRLNSNKKYFQLEIKKAKDQLKIDKKHIELSKIPKKEFENKLLRANKKYKSMAMQYYNGNFPDTKEWRNSLKNLRKKVNLFKEHKKLRDNNGKISKSS